MRAVCPSFECSIVHGLFICHGSLQPFSFTAVYRVRIEYRVGYWPKAWVEEPKLRRRQPDEPIPHTYDDDLPCLFYTRSNEWTSDKAIAMTIVPWLLQWLFFYEAWLFTGVWQGGGIHPQRKAVEPPMAPLGNQVHN